MYRFCDVALLRPPTEWKTDVCHGKYWYISAFCKTDSHSAEKQQKAKRTCVLKSERLKSIFLIPLIFIDALSWIVNMWRFFFRSRPLSRSHRPNCTRNVLLRCIFASSPSYYDGVKLSILKRKQSREKKLVRNINVLWLYTVRTINGTRQSEQRETIYNIHGISNLVCLSFCVAPSHAHMYKSNPSEVLCRLKHRVDFLSKCTRVNCNWYRKDMKIPSINTSISKW